MPNSSPLPFDALSKPGYEPESESAGHNLPPIWKILLVDDDAATHVVTGFALEGCQFHQRPLQLLSAYSAAEAAQIIAQTPDIAVILLDVIMEHDQAGLDLVRIIRGNLGNDRVRIVLRSGEARLSLAQTLENYDVTDFVSKTDLTQERLYATVISALRGYQEIIYRIEAEKWRDTALRAELAQKLQAEFQERIGAELRQAQFLQQAILPSPEQMAQISAHYGLKIEAHFEPAFELAGDYWGVQAIDKNYLAILLLDVTGHGVGAALATFYLHSLFSHVVAKLAAHRSDRTVTQENVTAPPDPAQILAELNDGFHQAMPMGTLASGFLLIYDRRSGEFCWSAAAAPAALYLPHQSDKARWLEGGGGLLGAIAAAHFPLYQGSLRQNDRILLYSDALIETRQALEIAAATGEDASAGRLLKIAEDWHQQTTTNLAEFVTLALGDETRPLRDDLTLVFLERVV